jgi:hypothetical protein
MCQEETRAVGSPPLSSGMRLTSRGSAPSMKAGLDEVFVEQHQRTLKQRGHARQQSLRPQM